MDKIYIECEGRSSGLVLLDCFPNIIKSLFIDEIGLPPGYLADICLDTASFDEAGNAVNGTRKDWKCDTSIGEIYSMDLISELSKESACVVMPNYLNNEKIIVLDVKSTSRIISLNDILIDKNGLKEIKLGKTEIENVYNSFVIRYCRSFVNNSYQCSEFVNKDNTSLSADENIRSGSPGTYTGLCQNSNQRYNKNSELVIEGQHIRDRSTAVRLLKWYADWLTRRKYIAEVYCVLNSNIIDLEVGDQIKLDSEILPSGVRNLHNFIITEMETDYLEGTVYLKLLQMSYPL